MTCHSHLTVSYLYLSLTLTVTLEKLLQMVKHCPTDHELEFLVEGGVWKGRKVVWQAIFDRWTELYGNQQEGGSTQFETDGISLQTDCRRYFFF